MLEGTEAARCSALNDCSRDLEVRASVVAGIPFCKNTELLLHQPSVSAGLPPKPELLVETMRDKGYVV